MTLKGHAFIYLLALYEVRNPPRRRDGHAFLRHFVGGCVEIHGEIGG